MPQLSTGLVIAGAYADKVRRVLFAQLKDELKSKRITPQQVAFKAGELNRVLYDILVNTLKVDKGDVVRIRIEYEVVDGDIKWNYSTLQLEVFRRVPQEEVDEAVRRALKRIEEILAAPVSTAEAEWTGEKAEAGVRLPVEIHEGIPLGETADGETIVLLKDREGNNIGMAVVKGDEEATKITALIVSKGSYKAEVVKSEPVNKVLSNMKSFVETLMQASYVEIPKEEAEKIIREKMQKLI